MPPNRHEASGTHRYVTLVSIDSAFGMVPTKPEYPVSILRPEPRLSYGRLAACDGAKGVHSVDLRPAGEEADRIG